MPTTLDTHRISKDVTLLRFAGTVTPPTSEPSTFLPAALGTPDRPVAIIGELEGVRGVNPLDVQMILYNVDGTVNHRLEPGEPFRRRTCTLHTPVQTYETYATALMHLNRTLMRGRLHDGICVVIVPTVTNASAIPDCIRTQLFELYLRPLVAQGELDPQWDVRLCCFGPPSASFQMLYLQPRQWAAFWGARTPAETEADARLTLAFPKASILAIDATSPCTAVDKHSCTDHTLTLRISGGLNLMVILRGDCTNTTLTWNDGSQEVPFTTTHSPTMWVTEALAHVPSLVDDNVWNNAQYIALQRAELEAAVRTDDRFGTLVHRLIRNIQTEITALMRVNRVDAGAPTPRFAGIPLDRQCSMAVQI